MANYQLSAELSAKDAGMVRTFDNLIKQLDDVSDAVERMRLGETINSSASLARTSLDKLTQSYKSGQIDLAQYEDATRRIQHAFGLVTPETERAAARMEELHRAFAQGEISADEYERELVDLSKSLDQVGQEGGQTSGILGTLLQGAMMGVGQAALGMLRQLPRMALQFAEMGAAANRQATALNNLAREAGTTGDAIMAAIQKASGYTIDRMTAMSAANKAMMLDVAETPDQFERLTKVAVALGRAMGQDAAKSIDDFVVAAGRQSMMIADNLGLTIKMEQAQENYAASLGKTVGQLTEAEKKQAFLNEMLRQGEIKLAALGEPSADLATDFETLRSVFKDATTDMAMLLAESIAASEGIRKFALNLREATENLRAEAQQQREARAEAEQYTAVMTDEEKAEWRRIRTHEERAAMLDRVRERLEAATESTQASAQYQQYANREIEAGAGWLRNYLAVMGDTVSETKYYATADGLMRESVGKSTDSWNQYSEAIRQAELAQDKAAAAALDLARQTEIAAAAANQAREIQLGLSMSLQAQLESREESEARMAQRREEIEAEHAKKLEELRKRGQATAIRLNEAAEQEKLDTLRRNLEIALAEQAAYTEKTALATQMKKEDAIAKLQAEIAAQEKLLDDYHAGRLVKAGENVTALIAEEERLHQERLKALDEEMQKQNEMQEKAMGQWMLSAFDAWASTKDIPEDQKNEWVKKTIEMRTSIAEEYGLVSAGMSEMVADMWSEWDSWATDMDMSTSDVATYLNRVTEETGTARKALEDLTAHDWWVRVRYEMAIPDIPRLQQGTNYWRGGMALVGEAGPELVVLPRGAQVRPNYTYNDTVHIHSAPAAAMYLHQRDVRRAQLSGLML